MGSRATIRVAAVQMEPTLGQVGRNLQRIISGLEHAANGGAKLAVFPECALSGYGFASRDDGYAHAVAADGPEVAAIAEVAGASPTRPLPAPVGSTASSDSPGGSRNAALTACLCP